MVATIGVQVDEMKEASLSDGAALLLGYLRERAIEQSETMSKELDRKGILTKPTSNWPKWKEAWKMMQKGYYVFSVEKVEEDLGRGYNWQRRCFKELVDQKFIKVFRKGYQSQRWISFLGKPSKV